MAGAFGGEEVGGLVGVRVRIGVECPDGSFRLKIFLYGSHATIHLHV